VEAEIEPPVMLSAERRTELETELLMLGSVERGIALEITRAVIIGILPVGTCEVAIFKTADVEG